MKTQTKGIFAISLDFELYWGMKDVVSIEEYADNLDGTPKAIELLLELFKSFNIHTTWASVGYIFCEDRDDLQKNYPKITPSYKNDEINLYNYIKQNKVLENRYHFAPKYIDLIASYPNQEIATHTFSHYYCLEEGQNEEAFYEDLEAAKKIAKKRGVVIKSLVFPRNQHNNNYVAVIKKAGIKSYRGNERGWIYNAVSEKEKKTPLKRVLRIVDSYINLSGYHTYKLEKNSDDTPLDIPASRFLRPYSPKLSFLDPLRLKRIKDAMSKAAISGELFHLWWHPHNFGIYTDENILILEKILEHYKVLEMEYGFKSLTMGEISDQFV